MLYQIVEGELYVLLVHPGGPYVARKDVGHWSIPKGEPDNNETDLLECARREFSEETGHNVDAHNFISLGSIRQKGGKVVHAWAFEGVWRPEQFSSNSFTLEWPPKSGKQVSFPEVDRAELLPLDEAMHRIKDTQRPLLERLSQAIADGRTRSPLSDK